MDLYTLIEGGVVFLLLMLFALICIKVHEWGNERELTRCQLVYVETMFGGIRIVNLDKALDEAVYNISFATRTAVSELLPDQIHVQYDGHKWIHSCSTTLGSPVYKAIEDMANKAGAMISVDPA